MFVGSKLYGVATWGYNTSAGGTASYLFGSHSRSIDYLDNLRLVAIANPVKMQPSAFLSIVQRLLFQHRPSLKYLVAYGDGYHGYRGTIYKAANWLYTGTEPMDAWWIPGYGIMSQRSISDVFKGKAAYTHMTRVHPTIKKIRGYKYRYIRFRDQRTQDEMMKYAQFQIRPISEIPEQKDMYIMAYAPRENITQAKKYPSVPFRSEVFVPYNLRMEKVFRGAEVV